MAERKNHTEYSYIGTEITHHHHSKMSPLMCETTLQTNLHEDYTSNNIGAITLNRTVPGN